MPAKTPRNNQARNQTEYKRLRKQMLANDPTCEICGKEANTIDHIQPIDTFQDPLDANHPDNLRVLCQSCNSRLGARYGNAKRANHPTTHSGQTFFSHHTQNTPQDSKNLSEPYSVRVSSDSVDFGVTVPRLHTNTDGGDRRLLGDLVSFASDHLKIELHEWQQLVLGDQLCLRPDGSPMFRQSMVSVARRQGKTVALQCLVAWWLCRVPKLRGKPQTVLSTAHTLRLASELFKALAPVLEERFGAKVSKAYGRQEVTMPDGSRWLALAATERSAHGMGADLVVIDEIWAVNSTVVDDALIPTLRGRPGSLLSCWSTAGTSDSEVMLRMRQRGMEDVSTGRETSFYFAEYSPPPDLDPFDPAAWRWSNPRLGIDYPLDELIEESRNAKDGDAKRAFIRSTANVWTNSAVSWLEPGMFEALGTVREIPQTGGVLAVEASINDSSFVGVRAVTVGEEIHVKLEFIVDSLRELWQAVDKSKAAHPSMKLAIGASLDLHLPQHLKGLTTIVGSRELQRWTTLALSMIRQSQVRHSNEPVLVEQVTNAALAKHGGMLTISTSRSRGPIELCRAFIWAVCLEGRPVSKNKAAMGAAK